MMDAHPVVETTEIEGLCSRNNCLNTADFTVDQHNFDAVRMRGAFRQDPGYNAFG